MADVFGRDIKYGGGFKPEGTTVTFTGAGALNTCIVRNVNIAYDQQISRIWDLGSGKCFFVAGHTNGTWGMGRIGGSGSALTALAAMTVCAPGTISFSGTSGACLPTSSTLVTGSGSYTCNSAVTVQISVAVTSDDMIINEGVGGTFLYLTV